MKKKILLRAPLLTSSGYGVHCRQVFEWLYNKKDIELTVECLNWGQTPWLLNEKDLNGLVGKIMECSKKVEPPYDISFQVQLPDEWDPNLAKKNYGITAVVETTKCSKKWIEKCNKMDGVIVPSVFSKRVLEKSGILDIDVNVIPEYYNHNLLVKQDFKNDKRFDFETNFNFLIIAQLTGQNVETDRKNIFNTIKWICEEFKNNNNVGIVVKTNMGKASKIDRALTTGSIKNVAKITRKGNFPKIHLLHGNMTEKEIAYLYQHDKIKCITSPTRGEGYGLPLVDAAASGMPVIATNWSGHLDFLEDKFLPVKYDLIEIPEQKIDNRIFYKGMKWANPNEKSFKRCLRKVYENYEKYKKIAKNHSATTANKLHKAKIFKKYDKYLME
jgi:glycosyltransferase involved in cell wall biosynthesis